MQTVLKSLCAFLAVGAFAALPLPTFAQYQFSLIDPPGSVLTIPYGMNDHGVITGFYYLPDQSSHGFVRSADGTVTTPALPAGAIGSQLGSVNNTGIAVGAYLDVFGVGHGATYNIAANAWTTLPDIAGTVANLPTGITNGNFIVGAAVGGYSPTGLPAHNRGYFYNGSGYNFFDAPGADINFAGTVPEDINESGVVAGFVSLTGRGGNDTGFLRDSSGAYTFLDYPGADSTFIEGINNSGVVAGSYDISGVSHSFIWSAGAGFTNFDVPFGFNTELWGIDNRGNLVGDYIDPQQGTIRGFVATAVPEPDSLALLFGIGTVGVGLFTLRRRR